MRAYPTVFILLVGLVLFPLGSLGTDEPLPEGKGKGLVESMCLSCHGLDTVTQTKRTSEEWQTVVDEMVSNGAPLLPREVETVVQYLAEHFAPTASTSSSAKGSDKTAIPVNTATAKDLESALGLSAKEAAAMVDYREKHGKFQNWDDLKKVPDLDVKKMESAKERLTF